MGKNKNSELTTRQWILYRYLKKNYADDKFITKQQICEDTKAYKFDKNSKRLCRAIEQDIRVINESEVIQKIIVSNKTGYKIGNKEEVKKYIDKRFKRDLKSLKLNWKLINKVKLDKQTRLTFETQARNTIETFIKE